MSPPGDGSTPRPVSDEVLDELVARADLDELIRLIDARTEASDWTGLLRLRDRARAAVATGRQLWPAATVAEYRLALWSPAEHAVSVLTEDAGRFTIGPLTEVVAQRHTFAELAPHLTPGPRAALVAHERAVRGESVDTDHPVLAASPDPLGIPYHLASWEPAYPVATYGDQGIEEPPPAAPRFTERGEARSAPPRLLDDPAVTLAVRQLVEPWTASSNGRAEVAAVEGDHHDALAALGAPVGAVRLARVEPADGLALLAWAGATGGAHGRRRGAALGRFGAWAVLEAIGGFASEPTPHELGELAGELHWYAWDVGEPVVGWQLRLAVHDPLEGLAWAVVATDHAV